MEKDQYKKTEKWWLGLVILFYLLYNIPGIPQYDDAVGALWHGALTLIPLWVIIYVGLFKLLRQRKLRNLANDLTDHKGTSANKVGDNNVV